MVLKACGGQEVKLSAPAFPRYGQASGRLNIPEPSPQVYPGCALPGPAQISQGPQ